MKKFDDNCEYTIEVFDDYDGTCLYWNSKELDARLSNYLKDSIKKLGRYFLDSMPSMSEIFVNGYIANEVIEIKGRQILQDVFVINRIWDSQWNEYEFDEIEEALENTQTSKTLINNNE